LLHLGISGWEIRVGVVPHLLIVELDDERLQLRVIDAQCTASIVDVLAIQVLNETEHNVAD